MSNAQAGADSATPAASSAVRRSPALRLQLGHIGLLGRLQPLPTLRARAIGKIGQRHGMHAIAVAFLVHAGQKEHRTAQHGRQPQGAGGKRRFLAQKWQANHVIVIQPAIRQQPQHVALLQLFARQQHGIDPVERNNVARRIRIDGGQNAVDLAGVFFVHQHVGTPLVRIAKGLEHGKAAEVRSHDDQPAPPRQRGLQRLASLQTDVEQFHLAVEHEHAVMNGGGKAQEVAIELPPAGRPLPQVPVELLQRLARARREQQEIQGDAAQHQAAQRPPQQ